MAALATATRVMVSAAGVLPLAHIALTTSSSFLLKPFCAAFSQTALSLRLHSSSSLKRPYHTCRAIYNPQVQIKKEGQPHTLEHRVFFVDHSGKKVTFFTPQFQCSYSLFCVFNEKQNKFYLVCRYLLGMIYHCNWVMEYLILLWRYLKIQVRKWRLRPMSYTLPSSKIPRRENFVTIRKFVLSPEDIWAQQCVE